VTYRGRIWSSAYLANSPDALLDLSRVEDAARKIRGVVTRTPVIPLDAARPHVWIKAESLQPTGAFKLRGAYYAMTQLSAAERDRGVITASSGNHAQALAWAARRFGSRAAVVMPLDAPSIKRRKVEALGAAIIDWTPGDPEDSKALAKRLAVERELTHIHSSDDLRVMAGAGTVGLELLEDLPSLAAVLVPIGGGGLASGIAAAIRGRRRGARIVGVEPTFAADMAASVERGRYEPWPDADNRRTIADGLRTNGSERTFRHISALMDAIVTVTDEEIAAAVRVAAEQARLVLEPAGATALAAWLYRRSEAGLAHLTGDIAIVGSGGNVDSEWFRTCLDPSDRES
jgi:threonine dehydratase